MQSRLSSLYESVINTGIGFGINFCANLIVLPWFGFDVNTSQAFLMGVVFTTISIVRGYVIRRWFNSRLFKKGNI